jgi:hypothetical protein
VKVSRSSRRAAPIGPPRIARFCSRVHRIQLASLLCNRKGDAGLTPFLDEDLEQRLQQVETRLRERLAPEDFRLVRQLRHLVELATVAACEAWQRRLLEALARHFPERELALRAVAAQGLGTDADCDTFRGLPSGRHNG